MAGAVARVFLSHASEDHLLAGEVHGWLAADGHEVFLDQDLRDGLVLGEEWQRRLYERLRWADAVVCVITSAYRASTWCSAEVGIAQAHGSRLLPLAAEPGAEHPLLAFGTFQYADLAGDPAAARAALAETLRRVDAAGGWGWPDDRSPFPGLRPFEPELHRVFFGRHTEVEVLADLLRSPAAAVDAGLVLVVGPSGCGKSSLVRGGLLPVMAGEPGWETLPPMLPGADPIAGLARAVAVGARRLRLDWTAAQVRDRLDHLDGLAVLADELLVVGKGRIRYVLLVMDQFEELLTLTAPAARERFAGLLKTALAGPVRVVATLRADFVGALLASAEVADLPTRSFMLRPLTRAALPAVIEEPARLAGIAVDDGLVARLVADTDTGDALPLLAFTLAQLAHDVGRGGRLSTDRYDQLGGVQGALVGQADAALAGALAASGRTREQAIAGLLRLVTVDEQGRPIRSRTLRDELPEPVRAEMDAFVARRLLTTDTDDDGRVVLGVAHEAFLSVWQPLAAAITAAASALRTRRVVEQAAAEWDHAGRPQSQLWERGQLATAVTATGARFTRTGEVPSEQRSAEIPPPQRKPLVPPLLSRRRELVTDKVDLSARARDFMRLSIRQDRRRRRRAVTVLSVLLAFALAATGLAYNRQQAAEERQQVAEEQERIATARQLVSQADAVRESDPRTALLLGIAAQHVHLDGETQASLVNTLTTTRYAGRLTGHTGLVDGVVFSSDGRTLATKGGDGTVILWDLSDRAAPRRLGERLGEPSNFDEWVAPAALSSDGRTLATNGGDGTVSLWDLSDRATPRRLGERLGEPLTNPGGLIAVALSSDGRTLATNGGDGTVSLWDLSDRAAPRHLGEPLTNPSGSAGAVALSSDGRTLVTNGGDGTVSLWDLSDRAAPQPLGEPLGEPSSAGGVFALALSSDGRTLVTDGFDGTVSLWDLSDRAAPRRLGEPLGEPNNLGGVVIAAFSSDGRTLATSSGGDTVSLWDLSDRAAPRRLGEPLSNPGGVFALAVSSAQSVLAAGGGDGTVGLWDLSDRAAPRRLGEPLSNPGPLVAFSSDGRTLATGNGTVSLWDLSDRAAPRRIGEPLTHPFGDFRPVLSSDGRTLATSGGEGILILWDLSDRAAPRRLGKPLANPNGLVAAVFSSDGQTLATGEGDTVSLWDLSDRAAPRRLGAPLSVPLTGDFFGVRAVDFSEDGRMLTTAAQGTVILWDLSDRAAPRRLGEPLTNFGGVDEAALSADGRTLAIGGSDYKVILWDLSDPAAPRRLGEPLTIPGLVALTFSSDGHALATGSDDGTVILWDLFDRAAPRPLGEPLTHTSWVNAVAFSPDARTLAASADDGTVLWDLTNLNDVREHATEYACAITGQGLNRVEWARYIRGLPYQSTCSSG
jgi:WD40 repeat protein